MLYPAELRVRRRSCSGGARGASIGLDQLAASGGTIGTSKGIAAIPSSRSASASSGEAWPWIRSPATRSEEHPSELQSLMSTAYAVVSLEKKTNKTDKYLIQHQTLKEKH